MDYRIYGHNKAIREREKLLRKEASDALYFAQGISEKLLEAGNLTPEAKLKVQEIKEYMDRTIGFLEEFK